MVLFGSFLQARIADIMLLVYPALTNDPAIAGMASRLYSTLQTSGEDQTVLLLGTMSPGKTSCAGAVLRSLLECGSTAELGQRAMEAYHILQHFTTTDQSGSQCLFVAEVMYERDWKFGGVRFTVCALNASHLLDSREMTKQKNLLVAFGMEKESVEWVFEMLSIVKCLHCGEGLGECGNALGIDIATVEDLSVAEQNQLAGMLYEQVVQWIGELVSEELNSEGWEIA